MLYCSATTSLCALEVLAHTGGLPKGMVEIKADLPEDLVEFLKDSDLPNDWNSLVDAKSTKDIGTDWAKSHRTVVLSVPSVVVPQERNFLLNPRHPEFSRILFRTPKPFVFDPRLK